MDVSSRGVHEGEMPLGIVFRMQHKISAKLEAAGATSKEKAVTIEEAGFNLQEQNWLTCVAGGLASKVRKTKDKRYYVTVYNGEKIEF